MKISIITVTFNSARTIMDTFNSIKGQDYPYIEYIVIDGNSSDETLQLIKSQSRLINKYISEPDNGIYDAMNKGLSLVSGDIIGFLHSDDMYADSMVLSKIANQFERLNLDALYGDVAYFKNNNVNNVVRKYKSNRFSPEKIGWGWMPAHPSLFLHRRIYEQYGNFKTDYKIAGDYEYVARVFGANHINFHYLPEVMVKMRMGGISTGGFKNSIILNKEVLRACRENKISTNIFKILSKYPAKLLDTLINQ